MDPLSTDPLYWEIAGIILCLVGSAYFSGSETALTSLTSTKANQLVDEEGIQGLRLWLERPIPVLTAILIGNNVVNVAASALATNVANRLLGGTDNSHWAIPAAVGVMTFLLLTFGEITPKAVAKRLFIRVSIWTIRIIRFVYYPLYPIIWLFVKFTKQVMRLLGNDLDDTAPFVTYEEIEYLIELGTREGTLTDDRERLLRSVVEFPDTLVKEVMVPRTDMVAIPVDSNLQEMLDLLIECGHSRLPVFDGSIDDVLGTFYAKDVIQLMADNLDADTFEITNYLRDVYFVPESKRISDLLTEFQEQHIHIAIVVDEFGGTAGIITLEDIIEEFFGDIQDEYDAEADQLIDLGQDRILADARIPIYEVEGYFGLKLPEHPDYESLGGFLLAQFGSVPQAGDEVEWDGLVFRVIEADLKKVISVEIERVVTEDDIPEEAAG